MVASYGPPIRGGRDLAHNPGMYPDWGLNWQPFGWQAGVQSTPARDKGSDLTCLLLCSICYSCYLFLFYLKLFFCLLWYSWVLLFYAHWQSQTLIVSGCLWVWNILLQLTQVHFQITLYTSQVVLCALYHSITNSSLPITLLSFTSVIH